jgi:uncharacterized protein YihD (DUF1040 family)
MSNKILMIVEGEKKDVKLMKRANELLGLDDHSIVSYKTNIYELYDRLVGEGKDSADAQLDPDLDLLQVLKEREQDADQRKILDGDYTDIVLIFDLDPQDSSYKKDRILKLMDYFVESTENGRLFLNYPMVEGLYHLKGIPDCSFKNRKVKKEDVLQHKYKSIVSQETVYSDFRKYDKKTINGLIKENLRKTNYILTEHYRLSDAQYDYKALQQVAMKQTDMWDQGNGCYVLGTCLFYYLENYPHLVVEHSKTQ